MSENPLPLSRYPLVRTRDPDEAMEVCARFTTPVSLEPPPGKRQFEWIGNAVAVGGVVVAAHSLPFPVSVRTEKVGDVYALAIPIGASRGESSDGNEVVELKPGEQGVVISPGRTAHAKFGGEYRGLQVNLSSRDLQSALSLLLGSPPRSPLVFRSRFSLTSPAAESFLRHLRFTVEEVEREGSALLSPPVAARHAETLLFQLLLAQPHEYSGALQKPAKPVEPKHVAAVAEYLTANLERQICMAELASLTGRSVRSIQEGFQKHRGQSPREFLYSRRLTRAHELLSSGDTSVTDVALSCGFEHLGRFSLSYRAHFGENPSETLSESRARRSRSRG